MLRTDLTDTEIIMLHDKLNSLLGYYGLITVTEMLSNLVVEQGARFPAILRVCERDANILLDALNKISKPL